jgi:hypothetical protein
MISGSVVETLDPAAHRRMRWLSFDTCSKSRLLVWDFLVVGNTKSVTIEARFAPLDRPGTRRAGQDRRYRSVRDHHASLQPAALSSYAHDLAR